MRVNSKPEPQQSSLEQKVDELTATLKGFLEHLSTAVDEERPEVPETPFYARLRFADGTVEDVANIADVEVYRKDSEIPVFIVGDDEDQGEPVLIVVAPDSQGEGRTIATEQNRSGFDAWGAGR